jgi:predicted alpha/beta hydrolase family esterase
MMQSNRGASLLIVPGLRGDAPQHWQSLLAASVPGARVIAPMSENGLSCAARVAAVEAAVADVAGPVILVAHSAGVLMVAHWAALGTPSSRRVAGALLAAAPDLRAPSWPASYPQPAQLRALGWDPLPEGRLPFPSILAASSDDYLCSMAASRSLAARWGSELVELGEVGHLNPAAGYGPWPSALPLIERLRCGLVAK